MTDKCKLSIEIEWKPGIMEKKWNLISGDNFTEEFKDEIWDEFSIDLDELKKKGSE